MKKLMYFALVLLSLAACKRITPEERIAQISRFFDGKENNYTAQLQQFTGEKQLDYLNLVLAKDLGAEDIWTIEADGQSSLIAEFPGKEKGASLTMISASLDDPAACSAILELFEAYKKYKIQHKNTIRALFYAPVDSTGNGGLHAVNEELRNSDELIIFDIELSTGRDLPRRTFVLEEKPVFAEQLIKVVSPYIAPMGDYSFKQGVYPNRDWPLTTSIYRYNLSADEFQKDVAVVTAFSFLLN